MAILGTRPNICSCSRMAAGFRWALAFSASAQPCARTIPLNLPMNSSRGEYAVKRKPPPDPRHRYWMPEELFPSVVRSHRAVMRWRQPRSIHLCDEHGCVQLVDAGGETTRGRVPRGVSETFEVSPTGSIPRRKNPAWQVANDKVEASRTMLPCGHEAPEEKRPLTRGTVEDSRKTNRRGSQIPNQKFTGREGAAEGGTMRYPDAAGAAPDLQKIVGQADQLPLGRHFLQASQQKLADPCADLIMPNTGSTMCLCAA